MSYCRWSSDSWKCDLYCFEHVSGGITTYVANNRIVGEVPKAPWSLIMEGKLEEFKEAHRKEMEFLDKAEHKQIGLPYDGESFNDPDYESFLERLLHLRMVGYHFPDYVLEEVKKDIEREKSKEVYHQI